MIRLSVSGGSVFAISADSGRHSGHPRARSVIAAPVNRSRRHGPPRSAPRGLAASARRVPPNEVEGALGKGYRLRGISAEVVPNGVWPLDFGGVLGEPVTRGIEAKLPWLNGADSAATALRAAGLPGVDGIDAQEAFTRK